MRKSRRTAGRPVLRSEQLKHSRPQPNRKRQKQKQQRQRSSVYEVSKRRTNLKARSPNFEPKASLWEPRSLGSRWRIPKHTRTISTAYRPAKPENWDEVIMMKKLIHDALPETFKQLQRDRQQAQVKIVTLTGKLEEHRRKVAEAAQEIQRLEGEIAEIVSAGEDPAGLLRKLRSQREGIGDLQKVVQLAEGAVEAAKGEEARIRKEMEKVFQKSVMETRNVIAEELQEELATIENRLSLWRDAIFSTAEDLNLAAPASGTEIILHGLK